ncbi:ABC transporter family protein [Chlamydia ibidis]|uniref:ABC transporter family protein n=2 Tax=Chlamydia ibidis TaxID=1405396 RepID=A0ABN0N0E6_9CHLA|nr:ABC-F family ATP-binding cassette domain-containing protein [Chlamydia ibidis]EPP34403.1 ABC transporter family protein [Chlamydia ibidis]EQM62939.1 ABC transporter family protein [Chlamydia ibidis 10-1398/6]
MSIVLDKIGKTLGTRVLFDDVSVVFNPGNRYGLTGPNGAGKSTLLKIITGVVEPSRGSISLPKKVGILRQNIDSFGEVSVLDCVIMGNSRLWDAFQRRDALYLEEFTDAIGIQLGEIEEVIGEENGYRAESEAEELLSGIGIPEEFFNKKMAEIPIDLQFRVLLCQALFGHPEALLLDEPTNHLDIHSINWLAHFLKDYDGTVIVVSHDRHFLNTITTHIADIDYDTIIIYPGNYDDMVEMKTASREQEKADIKSKEKKIAQLREFVSKFGAGSRASQVQSRLREIKKLQPQELKKSNIQRPYIRFPLSDKTSGKVVFSIEGITKSYSGNNLFSPFSLEIYQGDKIGVIGNNGLGKTTLMKLLAGVELPTQGSIKLGHQVAFSYFPQNHSDVLKECGEETLFEWLRNRKTGITDQEIRSVLGKMLFGGDDAFKQIKALSGGETARLLMAGMMLENHNVLILDEANNHLDLESVSALAWAINDYKGTSIFVSHDRTLIDECATKLLIFDKGKIIFFDGTMSDYTAMNKL